MTIGINKMKKTIVSLLVVIISIVLQAIAVPPQEIRIPSGMGNIIIQIAQSSEIISVSLSDQDGKMTELFSGTNLILQLDVAEDGCVGGITDRNKGYLYLDFFGTRLVDSETGKMTINNPPAIIGNKTNDIVSAWSDLSKTDKRFAVNIRAKDKNFRSIESYFSKNPTEKNRFITWRLTSVKTELTWRELCNQYLRDKARAKGVDMTKVEAKLKIMSESDDKFFNNILQFTDENAPIYWYKYRIENRNDIEEQGFLVVLPNGNIKKFLECGLAADMQKQSQPTSKDKL